MKISYLAATTLVLGLNALGTTATASCSDLGCSPHSGTSTGYSHTSTGYNLGHNSGQSYTGSTHSSVAANCPTGTSPSSDGTCLINDNGSSYFGSSSSHNSHNSQASHNSHRAHNARRSYGTSHGVAQGSQSSHNNQRHYGTNSGRHYTGTLRNYRSTTGSAVAPLGSYAGQTRHTTRNISGGQTTRSYGSGSVSRSHSNDSHTIVPFSTSATNISTHRLAGMGTNEVLTPTQCPVSVYNPNGGKVMGCYSVGTVAPRRTTVTRTVTRRIVPHRVRVVRPIIYVRYPVPIPVPFPVYQPRPQMGYGYATSGGCNAGYATRYGQQWPGRPCGY